MVNFNLDKDKKNTITAMDFVQKIKDLPISAIMIHGRTYEQKFSGEIDGKAIKDITPTALKAHKVAVRQVKKEIGRAKGVVKVGKYLFGNNEPPKTYVPADAYSGNVSGNGNIQPYNPQMIARAQGSSTWADEYL